MHLPVPISVDAEHGFSEDPREVAEYAQRLEALGVAGINLEDRNGDPDHHAARDRRRQGRHEPVRERPHRHVLARRRNGNARALPGLHRAGADGIFVPGVKDEHEIEALANLGAPLNVLFGPGMTVERLAAQGVARISTGSALYRIAIGAAVEAATAIRDGQQPPRAPSYEEVDAYQR